MALRAAVVVHAVLGTCCGAAAPAICSAQFCQQGDGLVCDRSVQDCPPCLKVLKSNVVQCVDNSIFGKCIFTGGTKCDAWTPLPTTARPTTTVPPTTTSAATTTRVPPTTTASPLLTSATPKTAAPSGITTATPTDAPASIDAGVSGAVYVAIGAGMAGLVALIVVLVLRHRRNAEDEDDLELSSVDDVSPHAGCKCSSRSSAGTASTTLNHALINSSPGEDSDVEPKDHRRHGNDTTVSVEF